MMVAESASEPETIILMDFHGLPILPDDLVRSIVKPSHMPIVTGNLNSIMGNVNNGDSLIVVGKLDGWLLGDLDGWDDG
jgi:hypothetical protein